MVEPVFLRPGVTLYLANCLIMLRQLLDASVDAIVTDPPAGIDFLGLDWDADKGGRDQWIIWMTEIAVECLRVLKPGGHAFVWALPRTAHWTATAWENAGFEVRDSVVHIFGQGFPKTHNLKGEFEGQGTALKPAYENWHLFRKPLDGTVLFNVQQQGVGALRIDACRIHERSTKINVTKEWTGFGQLEKPEYTQVVNNKGGYPANLVHDGSDVVTAQFPWVTTGTPGKRGKKNQDNLFGEDSRDEGEPVAAYNYSGPASAFFNSLPVDRDDFVPFAYFAKPSKREKNWGVKTPPQKPATVTHFRPTLDTNPENWAYTESPFHRTTPQRNNHPTVKRIAMMCWLIELICGPGAIVLDPFMGSGTTGAACVRLGRQFIGCDNEEGYFSIAKLRILAEQAPLF